MEKTDIYVRKRKKLVPAIVLTIILCIAAVCALYWFLPEKIVDISAENVGRIHIFNGTNGKEADITEQEDIGKIINSLNGISFKKTEIVTPHGGFHFQIDIYKKNGDAYRSFTIYSENRIRNFIFFYETDEQSINLDNIEAAFNNVIFS